MEYFFKNLFYTLLHPTAFPHVSKNLYGLFILGEWRVPMWLPVFFILFLIFFSLRKNQAWSSFFRAQLRSKV